MRYRIGMDLGTNSIGWAIVRLMPDDTPRQLIRAGVRLFPNGREPAPKGKQGESLAVKRRLARQMRRRRDRYLKRRDRFMSALIAHGLMPESEAERRALVNLDPYELRAKGLDDALPPHHLGRALFHLNQRRGFKSNRKVDKAADKEAGKIKGALKQTDAVMQAAGARTIGEWLWQRHREHQPVRARLNGQGAKASYELYVGRERIAEEFDLLWEIQRTKGANLSEAARIELREILLRQRDLKPVIPGKCTFEPDDRRAPLALPSTQRFRIYQELNNLRIVGGHYEETPLTLAQRDRLAADLLRGKKRTFEQMARALKLPHGTRFNLESDKRTELKGDATAYALGKDDTFGERWHTFSLAEQDAIVERLLAEQSESTLAAELVSRWGLPEDNALRTANLGLPEGYGRLGRSALGKILPELVRDVVTYDVAVAVAGYESHSDLGGRLNLDQLPYYGEALGRHVAFERDNPRNEVEKFGRLANPTVHIALNQVRGLVNAIVKRYGKPEQIVVEVTRDLKNGQEARKRIEANQKKRQDDNERYRRELAGLGLQPNGENLARLRLWEELSECGSPLNRCCVYTGEQISIRRLFSDEVEIEHLLPFARTLDDSAANKTVSLRRANRYKGNHTPHEAFHASTGGYDWEAIRERAQHLPDNKRWRFAENAMDRFLEDRDFLDRQLNDTAYLSRIAKEYLECLFPQDGRNHVWVTPGRLTALLRGKWGLNRILSDADRKDRTDHRHHAVDAAVIAVTDRAMLKQVADAAQRATETQLDRLIGDMPLPWGGYRRAVEEAVERIVVSYKPDHGVEGQLHNDTAYGLVEYRDNGPSKVVHRVPVASLTKPADFEAIRDAELRDELHKLAGHLEGKAFMAKLARWCEETGVRRVRILETLDVIPIQDRNGKAYKGYKGDSNYAIEIWRDDKGRWRGDVITTFEANQMARRKQFPLPKDTALNGKPLVMRLCKDDFLLVEQSGLKRVLRVVSFNQSGRLSLAEHHEGNVDSRNRDRDDPFSYLLKNPGALPEIKARRVTVDFLGIVHDPGFTP